MEASMKPRNNYLISQKAVKEDNRSESSSIMNNNLKRNTNYKRNASAVAASKKSPPEAAAKNVMPPPPPPPPATKLERKMTEDVDKSAEAFIQKFKKELLLQRLESIENYEQMLKRGT